ncbi:TIGR02452 family protein [Paenibacillus marinisediminis]
MNRDERRTIAEQTVQWMKQGYYMVDGSKVDIEQLHQASLQASELITPEQADELVGQIDARAGDKRAHVTIASTSTLQAILDMNGQGHRRIGVLNFASAKNPGGGFLNGALAQEESLAIASGLYDTQLQHEQYYNANRACRTMMYTDHMIYSPDVVFIRNDAMRLLAEPVTASVLTAPAVNYGQVLQKRENPDLALEVMKNRMRKVLELFAARGDRNLILGAYGCGVFGNDPDTVAQYWSELLYDENYASLFDSIVFAILDRSRDQGAIRAFQRKIEVTA